MLRGNCLIQQGHGYARCREAVLWIDRAGATESGRKGHRVSGRRRRGDGPRPGAAAIADKTWLGRFLAVPPSRFAPRRRPASRTLCRRSIGGASSGEIPNRANTAGDSRCSRHSSVRSAGDTRPRRPARPVVAMPGEPTRRRPRRRRRLPWFVRRRAVPGTPVDRDANSRHGRPGDGGLGGRRIRVFPRSNVPVQAQVVPSDPDSNQWIAVIDSGVNVIIDVNQNVPGIG